MKPTGADQLVLVARAQAGDLKARDELIAANMGIIWQMARKYAIGATILEPEDLVSEGVTGLMHAIEKFDASRGFLFMTYAGRWVHQRIAYAAVCARTPFGGSEKVRRLAGSGRFAREADRLHDEGLTDDEVIVRLAKQYELRVDTMKSARQIAVPLSLDAPIGEFGDSMIDHLVSDEEAADERIDVERRRAWVRDTVRSLGGLSVRDQAILDEIILSDEPLKLRELAERFGCSRERIRQRKVALVKRLQSKLGVKPKQIPEKPEPIAFEPPVIPEPEKSAVRPFGPIERSWARTG